MWACMHSMCWHLIGNGLCSTRRNWRGQYCRWVYILILSVYIMYIRRSRLFGRESLSPINSKNHLRISTRPRAGRRRRRRRRHDTRGIYILLSMETVFFAWSWQDSTTALCGVCTIFKSGQQWNMQIRTTNSRCTRNNNVMVFFLCIGTSTSSVYDDDNA